MGDWGPISQRLHDMAFPVVGGTTYAQYVVLPIHGRIATIHLHNATVGGLQQSFLTYETTLSAFRTLLIHSCYGGDHTLNTHNLNDGLLTWNLTNIYETIYEP